MDHAWAYASDQRQREENEDSFGVFDFGDFTLLLVCDGMGGHAGGRQASSLAVHTIWKEMGKAGDQPLGEVLEAAITKANRKIHDASRKNRRLMGMGTTVTAVVIRGDQAWVAHVGDSRVYLTSNDEIVQLTRDHSMVNLFVDAELLSPEEAASHPEAHVLSRSLGVERTVEVDVQEPLTLHEGDTFILCSDGVSGVVEDAELASQDWSDPKEAVRQVLWLVRDREGDDNATIAAAAIGVPRAKGEPVCDDPMPYDIEITNGTAPSATSAPPPLTPPLATPSPSQTIVPSDVPGSGVPGLSTPPPLTVPKASLKSSPAGASPAVPEASSPAAPKTVPAPNKGASALAEDPAARARRMRMLLLTIGGGSLGLAAMLVAGMVVVSAVDSGSTTGEPSTETTPAQVTITTPTGAPPAQQAPDEPAEEAPLADVEPPPAAEAEAASAEEEPASAEEVEHDDSDAQPTTAADIAAAPARFLWEPEIPVAPRRDPHRPTKYVANPPGGPEQFEAITAARSRECAESHVAVERAVKKSIDFARLYTQSWDCFDMVHQKPLLSARATSWQEFQKYVPHFQGYGGDTKLPYWYRPATAGVEYRLAEYINSNDTDLFAEVIGDYRGEEKLADGFSIDLLLEAEVAAVFATHDYEEMAPRQFWARRVHQVARAMNSRVGSLIKEHRPDAYERINKLMETATYGGWSDATMATSLPEPVGEALAVGRNERPAPRPQVVQKEEPPPPPPPPKVKQVFNDDGSMPIVHRRK